MIGNASTIEILWTTVTLVGLIANVVGVADAWADKRYLERAGLNGRRELVARWHVTLNIGLAYVQAAFLFAGILAMASPPAHDHTILVLRTALQLMFLTSEPVLVYLAIAAHRYRSRLLASRDAFD